MDVSSGRPYGNSLICNW